jgi:hypothetical protein
MDLRSAEPGILGYPIGGCSEKCVKVRIKKTINFDNEKEKANTPQG